MLRKEIFLFINLILLPFWEAFSDCFAASPNTPLCWIFQSNIFYLHFSHAKWAYRCSSDLRRATQCTDGFCGMWVVLKGVECAPLQNEGGMRRHRPSSWLTQFPGLWVFAGGAADEALESLWHLQQEPVEESVCSSLWEGMMSLQRVYVVSRTRNCSLDLYVHTH